MLVTRSEPLNGEQAHPWYAYKRLLHSRVITPHDLTVSPESPRDEFMHYAEFVNMSLVGEG